MTWNTFHADWDAHIDRIQDLFPYTDRCALERFRGNPERLSDYIADCHDLTPSEGRAVMAERLLLGTFASRRTFAIAAE